MTKPERKTDLRVKLTGQNGNVFNLIGIVRKALIKANHKDLAKEMQDRVFKAESYNDALNIMDEYVEIY